MDVSLSNKSKKRKSLSKANSTPSKILKSDSEENALITSPKNDVGNQEKGLKRKSLKLGSTPKAENKQNQSPKKNGGSSEILQKFPGTDSLNAEPQNQKAKRDRSMPKKKYLQMQLNEKAEKEGKEAVVKSLNEKIDAILSRTEITKTAKRRLRGYRQMLEVLLGKAVDSTTKQTGQDSTQSKQKKVKQSQQNQSTEKAKNKNIKVQSEQKKAEESESDEEMSDSDNVQKNKKGDKKQKKQAKKIIAVEKKVLEESTESDDEEKESDEQDQSDSAEAIDEEEESDNEEDGSDNEEDGSDNEEDGSENEEDGSENEEESSDEVETNKQAVKAKSIKKPQSVQSENDGEKKSRYILFIGNLAYDTTKQELEQHFERVGKVTDVRIPTDKESNKPRGFGYVEFADEASYQKALDMNGSQLKNRKIKVEYTQGGNKKSENQKGEMKAKNFKLHAMRSQGQFGGGNRGGANRRGGGGFRGRGRGGGGGGGGGFRGRGRGRGRD